MAERGKIPYRSPLHQIKVETTDKQVLRKVNGDLEILGVKKPIVLSVAFNGGYLGQAMDPHARIGFSAVGAFNRSDFGMSYGIPAAGSNMGVGDMVNVAIEAEFKGPTLKSE
jgi:polyisoprenoid-binding protein YceI